jgi:hypothetical protein
VYCFYGEYFVCDAFFHFRSVFFTGRKDTSKIAVEVRPGDFFSAAGYLFFSERSRGDYRTRKTVPVINDAVYALSAWE